jgi:hypothetical protein
VSAKNGIQDSKTSVTSQLYESESEAAKHACSYYCNTDNGYGPVDCEG